MSDQARQQISDRLYMAVEASQRCSISQSIYNLLNAKGVIEATYCQGELTDKERVDSNMQLINKTHSVIRSLARCRVQNNQRGPSRWLKGQS